MQYHTVNNNDYLQMYCTAGIQNGDHSSGITYSYYNEGPQSAIPLAAGLAVKYTTGWPGLAGAVPAEPAGRLWLGRSHPNPMMRGTRIRFQLPAPQHVSLRVYDVAGQAIATLAQGPVSPGEHVITWTGLDDHGRPVRSGAYYVRLETSTGYQVRRLMVIR